MKKLLIALVLMISVQLGAQPPQGRPQGQGGQGPGQSRELTDALSAFEKAKKEADNAKNANNPATWIKLSTAYANLYEAPVKVLWAGASRQELRILLAGQRTVKSEEQKIQGETMTVDTYADKVLYYNADGTLAAWKVASNQVPANALQEALKYANKAAEVDTKNQKTKDIATQLERIKSIYRSDGSSANIIGDFAGASKDFEEAYNISIHKLVNSMDTMLLYYAGLTSMFSHDYDRAIKFVSIALDSGYDDNGDAYSYLAEAYLAKSDYAKAKDVLNSGFQKYANNQRILIALINVYRDSNDDPEKILELVKTAQRNEPNNPTLYYAEGEVWKNLDNAGEAMKCYEKSITIDPNYVFSHLAIGSVYYEQALVIQREMSAELDDNKYEILVKEMEKNLESAIAPLEKGFALAGDSDVKTAISEYLKNIYFRFREKSPEHAAAYEKYNQYFLGNPGE